jgi:hypothetical protein
MQRHLDVRREDRDERRGEPEAAKAPRARIQNGGRTEDLGRAAGEHELAMRRQVGRHDLLVHPRAHEVQRPRRAEGDSEQTL